MLDAKVNQATWRAFERLYDQKLVRSIGVSNFEPYGDMGLECLLAAAHYKPMCNQVEIHPYYTNKQVIQYCEEQDIKVAAWSPLGTGNWNPNPIPLEEKPVSDPVIQAIGRKYHVSAGQVILKWNIQQQRLVIFKAESDAHIQQNIHLDFTLADEELRAIDALNRNTHLGRATKGEDTAKHVEALLQFATPE